MGIEFKTSSGSIILVPQDGDGEIQVKLPRTSELAAIDLSNVPQEAINNKVNFDMKDYQAKGLDLTFSDFSMNILDSYKNTIKIPNDPDLTIGAYAEQGKINYTINDSALNFTYMPPTNVPDNSSIVDKLHFYTQKVGFLRNDKIVNVTVFGISVTADTSIQNDNLKDNADASKNIDF